MSVHISVRTRVSLFAACLLPVVIGCSGCGNPEIVHAAPPFKRCGVTFWSGAMGIGADTLSRSTRGMPPAPADGWSHLPARLTRSPTPLPPHIVSLSDDCSHGRTVVVTPVSSVRLLKVAEDRSGRIVDFSLVPVKEGTTARIHVYAYDGRHPVGQLLTSVS
ncbi:hypothetical protein ABZT17_30410 [Streptomyces sp. NPDC005648]|uniref:hypothetical protein n=1 Tax=Streptomyces sp. NPDC005648 TaxID=3157044 RepID=UPI0033A83FEF